GITQVVRGADLLSSTARQLALYDALGYPRPREFLHVPLTLDATGVRMAKRSASAGLAPLRAAGMTPECLLGALAASCGLWHTRAPVGLDMLLARSDPARLPCEPTAIEL